MADYLSEQRTRLNELEARKNNLTPDDAQWLLKQLKAADWHLEELRDRIDQAGSSMDTSYVSESIDYNRWSRGNPRGPVTANN